MEKKSDASFGEKCPKCNEVMNISIGLGHIIECPACGHKKESPNTKHDKQKILLFNPPTKNKVMRDYYCSHSVKANYYWGPIDLFVLSGILGDKYDVQVIDSVAHNLDDIMYFLGYLKGMPDAIFMLTSEITDEEDKETIEFIKENLPSTKVYCLGDVAYFNPSKFLKEHPKVDGVVRDFSDKVGINLLMEGKILWTPLDDTKHDYDYPTPKFELFPLNKYELPYSRHRKVATVMLNYGCPYNCKFCNSGKLPFKKRPVASLVRDIAIARKQGVKEFYIRDFTFSADRGAVLDFCCELINKKIKIEWSCDARIDNMDEDMLFMMKQAGCFCIFYGVESADQEVLNKSSKGFQVSDVEAIFKSTRKFGISVLASFIIGLPGDTDYSILKTIDMAKRLPIDYASFNMFVPRHGTDFAAEYDNPEKDSSKEVAAISDIPKERLIELHKKAIREFYFRPKYIFRRIWKLRTFWEFIRLLKNVGGLK